MAYTFHYVTTPTGSLSGASMAQQTEDAINSVANTAEVARVTVLEAEDTIEAALNSTKNAQSQAESGLIEIRKATQELSHLNIPSGDGHVGEFLGTDGTRLQWQVGMRYLGSVADLTSLPSTSYTHATLVSGSLADFALESLQTVTDGGFNITVNGALQEISGLDFSALTEFSGIPAIINPKISAWGSCEYSETQKQQIITTTLYPWITADATARIYADSTVLDSTSVLYNADGTKYTGMDFSIASDGSGYVVMHGTEACIYTPSAAISIDNEETVTERILTFTTIAEGEGATISLGGAPSSSKVANVASFLQLATGIATNGQKVENRVGDFYFVTALDVFRFWDGSTWQSFSEKGELKSALIELIKEYGGTIPT